MGWRTGRGVASGVGGGRSAALSLSVLEPIAGGELVLHHLQAELDVELLGREGPAVRGVGGCEAVGLVEVRA